MNTRYTILTALIFLITAAFSAACVQAEPVRVLILTGANNHDWQQTTPVLKEIFENNKRFAVVDVVSDPSKLDEAAFAKCDVVVSNWSAYPAMTGRQWGPVAEKAFLDWMRSGKGFVVFHAAAATSQDWPEFQQLVGLTWGLNITAHGAYHPCKVVIEDANHPITKDMKDFWLVDELWHNMVPIAKPEFRVLGKVFSDTNYGGTGKFEPVLLTTQLGKGRGLNIVLGHDANAMRSIGWQTLMLRGAEWAATGEVTLPVPQPWPTNSANAVVSGVDPGATLKAVLEYKFGQPRHALNMLEQFVIDAASRNDAASVAQRKLLAAKLGAALSSNASAESKSFCCKMLAAIGEPEQTPMIAPLVLDEATSRMARYALQRIPGEAASTVLRNSLAAAKGSMKIGVVNSIGIRGERGSARDLIPLLGDSDQELAIAAAAALGKIGGDEAAGALKAAMAKASGKLRITVADAWLMCAEKYRTEGNKPAALAIYKELNAPNETLIVRLAAQRGMALCAPTEAPSLILATLAEKDATAQAMGGTMLRELPPQADCSTILKQFDQMNEEARILVMAAFADRNDKAALPSIRTASRSQNEAVRIAAVRTLGTLGDAADVKVLMERASGSSEKERSVARTALIAIRGETVNDDLFALLGGSDAGMRAAALDVLIARNAVNKLDKLIELAKDTDGIVRSVAWQAIGELSSGKDIPALLGLVTDAADADRGVADKAVAQSIIRAVDQTPDIRSESLTQQMTEWLKASTHPTIKKTLVVQLGRQATYAAMLVALANLKDSDTTEEAAASVVQIAGQLDESRKGDVKAAMQKILASAQSPEVIKRADILLKKAARPVNLARTAQASSPDGLEPDGASGPDAAANDGNPDTYWDETDGQKLYRLVLTFPQPTEISAINIMGHAYQSFSPKDFDILCDGKVVKTVQNAEYTKDTNEIYITFPMTKCTTLELKITGCYGESPGIRELEVYHVDNTAEPGT